MLPVTERQNGRKSVTFRWLILTPSKRNSISKSGGRRGGEGGRGGGGKGTGHLSK